MAASPPSPDLPRALRPVCGPHTACKCCGGQATLFGYVDFSKNCEEPHGTVLEPAGIPVPYHRCGACGFLFTTAFDDFTPDDFLRHVYNDEYARVDPRFEDARPRNNAAALEQLLARRDLRLLDYGGGSGKLARLLREAGFERAESWDPFAAPGSARPRGRFDCIVCFEVVEHSTDPRGTFADIAALLAEGGLVLFTTLLQPDPPAGGLGWWYVAPRNGHVSLHTRASLRSVVEPLGFTLRSADNLHLLYRGEPPGFAPLLLR